MKDLYSLSREESLFLARRTLAEHIWQSARLEGVNVTFPDTQAIIEGIVPAGMATDDVAVIVNLREAWRYLLASLDEPFGPAIVRELNRRVTFGLSLDPGEWRTDTVGIGGTDWRPPVPDEVAIAGVFTLPGDGVTSDALTFAATAMRAQLFWDGNKRTALLSANQILLSSGAGVLTVPTEHIESFNRLLSTYYQTGEAAPLMEFLYESCLFGLDLRGDLSEEVRDDRKQDCS